MGSGTCAAGAARNSPYTKSDGTAIQISHSRTGSRRVFRKRTDLDRTQACNRGILARMKVARSGALPQGTECRTDQRLTGLRLPFSARRVSRKQIGEFLANALGAAIGAYVIWHLAPYLTGPP